MIVGMMWADSEGTVEQRIKDAVAYYRKKYHAQPNVCHVHPETTKLKKVGSVKLVKDNSIVKNYFWIGVKE